MTIRVLLYGHYRDIGPHWDIENLPENATVADLLARLETADPRFVRAGQRARVAVDAAFASPESPLRPGCEVALLPPMSGG